VVCSEGVQHDVLRPGASPGHCVLHLCAAPEACCALQGVNLSEEEAEACVNLMDRDGDGKVVFDEVKEWWTSSSNIFRSLPPIWSCLETAAALRVAPEMCSCCLQVHRRKVCDRTGAIGSNCTLRGS
jgi:hypothetical protein